jgi:transposase InsO family protein
MGNRPPLSQAEKERIYWGKQAGRTLTRLAAEVGCSFECARKWWRVGRDKGLEGLRAPRRGRGSTGILSHFDPRVAEKALDHKRQHSRWGANRVLVQLKNDPELTGLQLPGRSRLCAFFKEHCPECVAPRKPRVARPPRPPEATGVHEVWQLDSQEGIRLHNGEIATVCNIRDPVGAAMIASRAFSVKTERHWRKLTWTEVRDVLRGAFTEWQTLPDSVQTDNELGLAGGPNDPYPGQLTLWLVGVGVKHRFIRPGCPTDQPHIERNHRTLGNFALDDEALSDTEHLQQALDRERWVHNHQFPSQASDCAGRPPLVAHPELLTTRRYYQPELELALFDLQRVYDHLATFTFKRKVSSSAQVSLGRHLYSLGKKLVREQEVETVLVHFDGRHGQWVFFTETGEELIRRRPKGLDVHSLTDLDPSDASITQPVQLTFPCFIA